MKLTPLLTDHAVVQRHQSIPVWGWTRLPRVRLRARLGPVCAEGISGDDARFLLRLPELPAGGPHTLTVETFDGSDRAEVKDILVGEVWLASGQSNMEWSMADSNFTAEIEAAEPRQIRMIKVERRAHLAPQSTVVGTWNLATPQTLPAFSAVGTFFGQKLQDELGVPVGIIHSSWGGTIIETWISRERLLQNPDTRDWTLTYEKFANSSEGWEKREQSIFMPADPGNEGVGKGWHLPEFDDRAWNTMAVPGFWQDRGHDYSAVIWFRNRITLPVSMRGKKLALHLGAVDKTDITYVNGAEVGRTGAGFDQSVWNQPRVYTIPAEATRCGEVVIAVRAYSFINGGGMLGPVDVMRLTVAGDESGQGVPLAGDWRFAVEHNFGKIAQPPAIMGHDQCNSPYMCFENMIRPLLPVGLAGFIWYQGESNAGETEKYGRLLRDLIADWRFHFGQADLPFGVVQLTSYMLASGFQANSSWARLREAQQEARRLPRVGLAVILDAGEADDIHPKDKKTVGLRLARWALNEVYGRPEVAGGPLYRGHRVEGSRVRILFDQAGSGLALRDGTATRTLVVAGRDGVFQPACSAIEGGSLLVWHAGIQEPFAVRYAWADNPEGANLINAEGIPAGPFRTDGPAPAG